jgi:hypothetical protein
VTVKVIRGGYITGYGLGFMVIRGNLIRFVNNGNIFKGTKVRNKPKIR